MENREDYSNADSLKEIEEHVSEIEEEKTEPSYFQEDEDTPDVPEQVSAAIVKYQISADISKQSQAFFDMFKAFFGRHVVNSNTKRTDNLRHLDEIDLAVGYKDVPYMRCRTNEILLKTTSEYQMCRSNQEIGGFDRKIQYTNIKRDLVDVKQEQTTFAKSAKKTGGILGFLRRKKGE